jgi:ankyrin repeat protein
VLPILNFACANYGEAGNSKEKSLQVIRTLVARGAKLDSRYTGLTPLHETILYSANDESVELVRTLLELGADADLRVSRPGKRIDGLTSIEFAEFLSRKRPAQMQATVALLRQAASNHSFKVAPGGAPQFNR